MPKKKLNKILMIFLIVFASLALMLAIYFLPPVHDRLSWRLETVRADIFYFLNPPEENAFSPGQQKEMELIVRQTQTAMAITPTPTVSPSPTPTNYVTPTPTFTASPTPTATPIPESVQLDGIRWEKQVFNNCGPANLSMALSYWGWEGDQETTGNWLRPNPRDRNVMPYEMVEYVRSETDFSVIHRYGGDIELIKKFVAAGFPVLIEKGYEVPDAGWMGHYGVITGYDDATSNFTIQDSYPSNGENMKYSYERTEYYWQSFNYLYLVIFPPDRINEINSILGPHSDETYNLKYSAQKALEETVKNRGRDLFFSWYNYGTSLRYLNDYYGAAQAFDNAYEVLQDEFEGYNPVWRITWYQTDPYFAYYNTGRYQDVIDLANDTFSNSFEPAIEESWVWRGRAKYKLGDVEGAIEDFREALKWHPGWGVAEAELQSLGVTP